MTSYDVFNGDADGICALQQLRLQSPRESVLVSGLKRDINLLARVSATSGDAITVLDVSLDKNRSALRSALANGASVFYADHHYAGEIPQHGLLEAHINLAADTCTSLIINQYLDNAHASWAVVGAFGDNFDQPASALGHSVGLAQDELDTLQQLGICLNYNGYGFELDDLMFHPIALYKMLHPYADPLEFVTHEPAYQALLEQYQTDMQRAASLDAESKNDFSAIYLLPNQSWAKRIVGVLGNDLAKQFPERAHALLVDMGEAGYRVSVRAPYHRKQGADTLCRQFPGGGGRSAAAGINQLAHDLLPEFEAKFSSAYGVDE